VLLLTLFGAIQAVAAEYAPILADLGVVRKVTGRRRIDKGAICDLVHFFDSAGAFLQAKSYYSLPVEIPACSQPGLQLTKFCHNPEDSKISRESRNE
jgi:hypothetical protein